MADLPHPDRDEPLRLADLEPFAVGGRRACYVHPHEPDKCVKVLRTDDRRTVRISSKKRILPARFHREYDNNAHEKKILDQLAARIGPEMGRHLPECFGYVDTDLGRGLVLTLVRDHDGPISRSLRQLITDEFDLAQFRSAFDDLAGFLLDHRVLTRGLFDHNIVARDRGDGTWRLVIIDGVGDPAWIPLASWLPFLARRKIARRVAQAWPRFEAFAKTGGVSPELLANSTWDQGILRHRG